MMTKSARSASGRPSCRNGEPPFCPKGEVACVLPPAVPDIRTSLVVNLLQSDKAHHQGYKQRKCRWIYAGISGRSRPQARFHKQKNAHGAMDVGGFPLITREDACASPERIHPFPPAKPAWRISAPEVLRAAFGGTDALSLRPQTLRRLCRTRTGRQYGAHRPEPAGTLRRNTEFRAQQI